MSIDNFTNRAEAYAKGRPGYTDEAVKKIIELAPENAVFADIGAGTGKLTNKLADTGCMVYVVEPNADMRGQMTKELATYKNVTILDGTAENTKIPDNSVDVITVAHALHWFDIDTFKTECKRILKENGLVVVIYNHVPGREDNDFCRRAVDKLFENPNFWSFENPIDYTKENWLAYIQSQDDSILPGEPRYEEYIKTLSKKFDEDSVNGLLHCDRLIRVYYEGETIEQYINNELTEDEKNIALEFVEYLRDKNLTFYKDNCECWRDRIYYWVKYGEECVCFIAIKDPEEKDNHWTVWSADMGSEWLAQYQVDEKLKEYAWKRIDHCGHCGSCGGGRTKVIFGKEFDDVCGCTFRIDNPDRMDLEVLKVIVDIRMKEIEACN